MINKLKLLRRRIYFNAVYLKLVICKVNAKLIVLDLLNLRGLVLIAAAAKHRLYARYNLFSVKRLAYIIVRSELKP